MAQRLTLGTSPTMISPQMFFSALILRVLTRSARFSFLGFFWSCAKSSCAVLHRSDRKYGEWPRRSFIGDSPPTTLSWRHYLRIVAPLSVYRRWCCNALTSRSEQRKCVSTVTRAHRVRCDIHHHCWKISQTVEIIVARIVSNPMKLLKLAIRPSTAMMA
ncbi:hypothetical protein BJX76DRAFT_328994 [Aspergillus varians]